MLEQLIAAPPPLPVAESLEALTALATPGNCALITAPAGSGKTTLLSPAIAVALGGLENRRVLVTQPRRVAVRAAARRIASLLGQDVGQEVGYSVRGDRRVSETTRIEMLTPGVLLRRLQNDPELPGVGAVVLDEFHERDLDTDLALAFCLDVRTSLREDLFLAITSATLDTDPVAKLLAKATGTACITTEIPTPIHSLDIVYKPMSQPALTPNSQGHMGVNPKFLAHCSQVVAAEVGQTEDDILVFLPGVGEIERVRQLLSPQVGDDVEILSLHGQLSGPEQDRIFSPSAKQRIILATAIAESSLTVPRVRTVVDAGLAREPRLDVRRGIGQLVTLPASRARLAQRAGRAARLGPGKAIRLMDKVDYARRPAHSQPQIATSQLTNMRLQAAVWGAKNPGDLYLLDPPPSGAWSQAGQQLRALGAIDDDGAATKVGRKLAKLPLEPALARALWHGSALIGIRDAAQCVATLAQDLRVSDGDLARFASKILFQGARQGSGAHQSSEAGQIRREAKRLEAIAKTEFGNQTLGKSLEKRGFQDCLALISALAYPQLLACKRPDSDTYLLANGVGAQLESHSPLIGQQWLAVSAVDRAPTSRQARILAAVPISEDDALAAGQALVNERDQITIENGQVSGIKQQRLGQIVLRTSATAPSPEQAFEAVKQYLHKQGLQALNWSKEATNLRQRMEALHLGLGSPWPDVSEQALLASQDSWLAPYGQLLTHRSISQIPMLEVMRSMLPWPQAAQLDELAPVNMLIPSGISKAIDWSSGRPVLTLRVQQAFGWTSSPRLIGGEVALLLHLTDPAGRPVAITDDLASFWAGPYQQVRSQLRGRYTKHPWPQDPLNATPTNRAKPRK